MASSQEPEIQFAQRLASNEKPIRTKAIKKLRKYIIVRSHKSKGGFTSEELLKLWKGLFYCLWMQDKPLLQEELSNQISGLFHCFQSTEGQFLYLEAFLETVKREWTGIDRLRMDKFYQLVRFVFRWTFEMLKKKDWDASLCNRFLELLTAQVLHSNSTAPSGLQFHILDLYLAELALVGSTELSADQNLTFINPFCKIVSKTKDHILFKAICSSIFSTIIDQAPFAIEDLMREMKAVEDADSGQASDEEEDEEEEQNKPVKKLKKKASGKQSKGSKSNAEEEEDDDDKDLHPSLDDSDTELPDDEGSEPVLQFDYAAVADRLFEFASRGNTPSHNRQRLYKIIKMLRDLSEGIFPQDEYPEEVSTDEDDDMFGSRKRLKRRRGPGEKEEEEEGPAAKKKKKKKKSGKTAEQTGDEQDSVKDGEEHKNKVKKRKRAKKKKTTAGGEEGAGVAASEDRPECPNASVTVTEPAGQSEAQAAEAVKTSSNKRKRGKKSGVTTEAAAEPMSQAGEQPPADTQGGDANMGTAKLNVTTGGGSFAPETTTNEEGKNALSAEASITEANITEASSTKASITDTSSTKASITDASSTEASSTEASSTEASITDTSSTKASITDASSTEASSTEASSTEASITDTSSTKASITDASSTEASSTEASSTKASFTEASITEASSTEASITEASITEASSTEASITEASIAEASSTEASITDTSSTKASSTEASSTKASNSETEATPTLLNTLAPDSTSESDKTIPSKKRKRRKSPKSLTSPAGGGEASAEPAKTPALGATSETPSKKKKCPKALNGTQEAGEEAQEEISTEDTATPQKKKKKKIVPKQEAEDESPALDTIVDAPLYTPATVSKKKKKAVRAEPTTEDVEQTQEVGEEEQEEIQQKSRGDTATPQKKKKIVAKQEADDESPALDTIVDAPATVKKKKKTAADQTPPSLVATATPASKKKKMPKAVRAEPTAEDADQTQEVGEEAQEEISALDVQQKSRGDTAIPKQEAEDESPALDTIVVTTATLSKKKKKAVRAEPTAEEDADQTQEVGAQEEVSAVDVQHKSRGDTATPQKKKKIVPKQESEDESPAVDTTVDAPATVSKKKKKTIRAEPTTEEDADQTPPSLVATATPASKKKRKPKSAAAPERAEEETPLRSSPTEGQQQRKRRRKIPVVFEFEADEVEAAQLNGLAGGDQESSAKKATLQNGVAEEPSTPQSSTKSPGMKKRKKKSHLGEELIHFQDKASIPTPLFYRTKGGLRTPPTTHKRPQSPEAKKVTFGLKNNKTAEFKKTDRSLLVSPEGSLRVPFDPKQKPKFGVLKSPVGSSPMLFRKTPKPSKKKANGTPKRRPTAADFF